MAYHPCGEVVVNLLLSAKRLDIIGNTDQRDTRRRNPIQQKVNGGQKKQKRAQDAALPRALWARKIGFELAIIKQKESRVITNKKSTKRQNGFHLLARKQLAKNKWRSICSRLFLFDDGQLQDCVSILQLAN
jgi:hypothetical protein